MEDKEKAILISTNDVFQSTYRIHLLIAIPPDSYAQEGKSNNKYVHRTNIIY